MTLSINIFQNFSRRKLTQLNIMNFENNFSPIFSFFLQLERIYTKMKCFYRFFVKYFHDYFNISPKKIYYVDFLPTNESALSFEREVYKTIRERLKYSGFYWTLQISKLLKWIRLIFEVENPSTSKWIGKLLSKHIRLPPSCLIACKHQIESRNPKTCQFESKSQLSNQQTQHKFTTFTCLFFTSTNR